MQDREASESAMASDRVFLKVMPKRGVISSASAGSYRRGLLGLSRYSRG